MDQVRNRASAREDKLITVIAAPEGAGRSVFTIHGSILCISPVLKDYLKHEETVPPEVRRNGPDTLTFNTSSDVMTATLDHIKWKYCGRNEAVRIDDKSAVFHVQLYKMALCFGLDELCTGVLESLRIQAPCPDDFLLAAIEASRLKLIEEKRFRTWFTSYIRKRHEDLLKPFDVDDNAARLCSILVSSVALSHPDVEVAVKPPSVSPQDALPATPPPSTSRKVRQTESEFTIEDARNVYRKAFETAELYSKTPTKREIRTEIHPDSGYQNHGERLAGPTKKRKYAAIVQDAVDECDMRS